MIEIWQECSIIQATNQRLANQVRTKIKKVWFSDLEILELQQKINKEPPTSENGNTTQPNNAPPPKKTVTRTKGKNRKFKENYKQLKDYLTIIKKHRMENRWDRNELIKSSTTLYINE